MKNNSPESTCKRTRATIYMCVAVFGFISVLALLEHFSIDKVV